MSTRVPLHLIKWISSSLHQNFRISILGIHFSSMISLDRSNWIARHKFKRNRLLSTSTSTTSTSIPKFKKCWNCQENNKLEADFCKSCNIIQEMPYHEVNLFKLLDLPQIKFKLNKRDIRERVLKKQQKVHPDIFSLKSPKEHQLANQQSILLNRAYFILGNPIPRVEYMLKLYGINWREEEVLTDPDLLISVMETREKIENSKNQDQVNEIERENQSQLNQTLENIEKAFEKKDFKLVKEFLNKLQYLDKIKIAAEDWESKYGKSHS